MDAGFVANIEELFKDQDFDSLAISLLDFSKGSYEAVEFSKEKGLFYDLASVTKVLTLASTRLTKPEIFNNDLDLLINHRAGLPAWGLLPHNGWQEQLTSYSIKESETLYSDFSALRTMLEIERQLGHSLLDHCKTFWDEELCYWKELPTDAICPNTGWREGKAINSVVHDPNAYVISDFCSHAGAFATIGGISRTVLALDKNYSLVNVLKKEIENNPNDQEYVAGWNRKSEPGRTLAGTSAGPMTFGHTGFTGTALWIDPQQLRGVIVLSNATQNFWYEKAGINQIRRSAGTYAFQTL